MIACYPRCGLGRAKVDVPMSDSIAHVFCVRAGLVCHSSRPTGCPSVAPPPIDRERVWLIPAFKKARISGTRSGVNCMGGLDGERSTSFCTGSFMSALLAGYADPVSACRLLETDVAIPTSRFRDSQVAGVLAKKEPQPPYAIRVSGRPPDYSRAGESNLTIR
jgi:hypothetical protein